MRSQSPIQLTCTSTACKRRSCRIWGECILNGILGKEECNFYSTETTNKVREFTFARDTRESRFGQTQDLMKLSFFRDTNCPWISSTFHVTTVWEACCRIKISMPYRILWPHHPWLLIPQTHGCTLNRWPPHRRRDSYLAISAHAMLCFQSPFPHHHLPPRFNVTWGCSNHVLANKV